MAAGGNADVCAKFQIKNFQEHHFEALEEALVSVRFGSCSSYVCRSPWQSRPFCQCALFPVRSPFKILSHCSFGGPTCDSDSHWDDFDAEGAWSIQCINARWWHLVFACCCTPCVFLLLNNITGIWKEPHEMDGRLFFVCLLDFSAVVEVRPSGDTDIFSEFRKWLQSTQPQRTFHFLSAEVCIRAHANQGLFFDCPEETTLFFDTRGPSAPRNTKNIFFSCNGQNVFPRIVATEDEGLGQYWVSAFSLASVWSPRRCYYNPSKHRLCLVFDWAENFCTFTYVCHGHDRLGYWPYSA